ncbi:MAG: YicC family protein [Lachnospiraceae bacterium]|nr:YicC family protein [Lachnospiraceae bacterium]MBQ5475662.1 YicC family protein [Lachnospiraceae bacterium]
MIRSMTGFGHGEALEDSKRITVEIKAVNHKYLDVNIKMPKMFNAFEAYLRGLLKEYAQRGKVDIYISYENFAEAEEEVIYNENLAKQYADYINKMQDELDLDGDISIRDMLCCRDVFTMKSKDADEEELKRILTKAFKTACENFVDARNIEGENLKKDLLEKLDIMSGYVDFIEKESPNIITEYKTKLREKIADLLGDNNVDETRIAQEVTIFADKVCVDEEIVRLKSHIDTMKNEINKGGFVGRKLDFVAQEMNREANTTLSKSSDINITNTGIELRTLIEKIREQIQNIE